MTVKATDLTDAEQDRILELAAARPDGSRMKCDRVAAALGRPPNMVRWFMYQHGLIRPGNYSVPATYTRKNGEVVRYFSSAEDELILKMRREGAKTGTIAAALLERFGHKRRPSAIRTRLVMLAGFEAEAEERAEAAASPELARAA